MRNDNIFQVGSVVEGESLIGYEKDYQKLQRDILFSRGNLSFVGLHRMGKTSLLKKLYNEVKKSYREIIAVFVNMAELVPYNGKSLFDSLLAFIVEEVHNELSLRRSLDDCPGFSFVMNKFQKASVYGGMSFRSSFKQFFEVIKALNMHVLVILDEFDSAETVFETNADYELFRSLAAPNYAVSLVFISRRRLYMIEKKNENNSTFHSAFPESPLRGFSDKDSNLFFEVLKRNYDIELQPAQRERIRYYAGRSPYIYSAFCHELVERKINSQSSFDIDGIYKNELASRVTDYAEVLYRRLKTDGHLSKLIGILFGPSINVTQSDKDLLFFMGYLGEAPNNSDCYQALSGYFTDYLHNKHYVDDSWHNIIALEKLMKKLILDAFRSFDETKWKDIMGEAYQQLFGSSKTFNYSLYKNFIDNNLKTFNKKSVLPDVMSLHDVFVLIQFRWDDVFKKYFGTKNFSSFEEKFKLCALARNPLAHGKEEYLTKLQIEQVNVYCNEILELVNQNQSMTGTKSVSTTVADPTEGTGSSLPNANESTVSESNIGTVGILTDIVLNKNRGIKGKVFNGGGTVERNLLKHEPKYYLGRELRVKIKGLNPQKNAYLLQPLE